MSGGKLAEQTDKYVKKYTEDTGAEPECILPGIPGAAEASEQTGSVIALNAILENMEGGVGLLEIGPKIRVIYASEGLRGMTSLDSEALPCSLEEMGIHPDYENEYEQLLRTGAEDGKPFQQIQRVSQKGEQWIWRRVRAARVKYRGGSYPVMLELSNDVSSVIDTEQKLRESIERFKVAFRQTSFVLWEVDIRKRIFRLYNADRQQYRPEITLSDFPGVSWMMWPRTGWRVFSPRKMISTLCQRTSGG